MPPLFLVRFLLKTLPRASSLFLQSSCSLISRFFLESCTSLWTVVVVTRCFPLKYIKHNIQPTLRPPRLDACLPCTSFCLHLSLSRLHYLCSFPEV